MPNTEVCGIIQQSFQQLPLIQQTIAMGPVDPIAFSGRKSSKVGRWIRQILGGLGHWVLWCAHGCPRGVHTKRTFTVNDLAGRCRQRGWPFLLADCIGHEQVAEFARQQRPDLVIVLGQPQLNRDLLTVPLLGLIRVVVRRPSDPSTVQLQEGTELKVDHFSGASESTLALLNLPSQIQEGPLGATLKCDLLADDLLLQAAKGLEKGNREQASKSVKEWMQRILTPYLNQFEPACQQPSSPQARSLQRRHRSVWKLGVQSIFLIPWVTGRNLYRRLRGQYPILILAHHLVSDRPHRMGISTEEFWRQIRFLQRHYRIVSLSQAHRSLCSGSVSVPTVVLTLDDGYCDNFIALRAVAEETGASIVLFVATRQIELHREFDHDLATGTRGFFPLTWGQIRHWRRGVELGSHTRTHFDCGSSDPARLRPEIIGSRMDLETRLGRPARFFAFPFGKRDNLSYEALEIAASTYSVFVSAFGGENLPGKESGHQHLRRKNFYSDPWELELELQSVFGLVQHSKEKLKQALSLGPVTLSAWALRRLAWTIVHACLMLLTVLPPFRRLLNQISPDR